MLGDFCCSLADFALGYFFRVRDRTQSLVALRTSRGPCVEVRELFADQESRQRKLADVSDPFYKPNTRTRLNPAPRQ
jgi:hypothetical protein